MGPYDAQEMRAEISSSRGYIGSAQTAQAPGPVMMSIGELRGALGDLTGYVSNLENRTASVCRPAPPSGLEKASYASMDTKSVGASVASGEINDCTRMVYELRRRLGELMDRLEV